MTIKKKIGISNIFMILIPIVVTGIIIAVCLNTSLGSYWHTLENMYTDENGVQFAQSIMYNYQQELWDFNWVMCGKPDENGQICQSEKMTRLGEAMAELGYRFMITKDGDEIYSNLSEEDLRIGKKVAGEAVDYAKTLTASRYEVSVIKNTFWHGDKVFCITAIHPEKTDGEAVNYLKNYLLRYAYGIVAFFVLLSMAINGILSWRLSRAILKPLQMLSFGTKEIREGNLDGRMQYEKKDEFGEVCQDFDEMRSFLKESVQQRLEDEKRRKDLITGISHDLRTPLTSISGYVDGLLDGIADTPEKKGRYLEAIRARAKTMVNLVESLSEYSRLDSNFRYHMETVDLVEYISQYLEMVKPDEEKDQIETEVSCGKGEYYVQIDTKEFKRIFDNLFANTVKYRMGAASRVLISVKHTLDGRFTEFVFQDDGPGVPKDSLGKIFDSFYRVDDSRRSSEKGSGIGLAVVREIVKGHGGTIRAENRGGLAVIIYIPVSAVEKEIYKKECFVLRERIIKK